MGCHATPETLRFYLREKQYFGGMSSIVLASYRIINGIMYSPAVIIEKCISAGRTGPRHAERVLSSVTADRTGLRRPRCTALPRLLHAYTSKP